MVLKSSLILDDCGHSWVVNNDTGERRGAFDLVVNVGVGVAYCIAREHVVHIVGGWPANIDCGVDHELP